jgi:hypothetical protein
LLAEELKRELAKRARLDDDGDLIVEAVDEPVEGHGVQSITVLFHGPSHKRLLTVQRSARISRDNPRSMRAAWNCEPESRIIVMEKLCAHGDCTSIIFTKLRALG